MSSCESGFGGTWELAFKSNPTMIRTTRFADEFLKVEVLPNPL
jgi:hypothetical protein